jgi:hypothetical protein
MAIGSLGKFAILAVMKVWLPLCFLAAGIVRNDLSDSVDSSWYCPGFHSEASSSANSASLTFVPTDFVRKAGFREQRRS